MRIIGAFAAAAFAATPLSAQDYAAQRVVKSVGQADLLALVGSLGHQVKEEGEPGEVFVAAEDAEGVTYLLYGTACEVNGVSGCQGVMMQVRFDLPATTTFESLAKANLEQAAINTWADFERRTLGFTRYVVLDHGVTMANIRENVNVMLAIVADVYPIAAGEPESPAPGV